MQLSENEILRRVRRVEIKTRGLSDEIFAGKYHTAFRGRGMSFSEVREYRVGDDVRDIDWNVTARTERAHVKVYEEERELTMMLLVDVSPSRLFGSKELTKKNVITEIAAYSSRIVSRSLYRQRRVVATSSRLSVSLWASSLREHRHTSLRLCATLLA